MLPGVEVPPDLLLGDGLLWYSPPTAAYRSQGGLDEYHPAGGAPAVRRRALIKRQWPPGAQPER